MAIANQLVKVQLEAENVFKNLDEPALKPRIGALAAVMAESKSVRLNPIYSNNEKKRTVEVWFPVLDCDPASVSDCPTDCVLNYAEVDTTSKQYALTRCRNGGFSMPERAWETNPLNATNVAAKATLMEEKKLVEDLNQRVHAVLNTPANLTPYDDGRYPLDGPSVTVQIPAAHATSRIFSYLSRVAQRIGMVDPYLIYGGALWELYQDINLSITDPNGQSNARKAALIRGYGDFTMDATLGAEKFFLVEANVLAILNRPDWTNTAPRLIGGDLNVWQKTVTVANTPIGVGLDGAPVSLKLDVRAVQACQNRNDVKRQWAFDLNADVVLAPADACANDYVPGGGPYTGIVAFEFV